MDNPAEEKTPAAVLSLTIRNSDLLAEPVFRPTSNDDGTNRSNAIQRYSESYKQDVATQSNHEAGTSAIIVALGQDSVRDCTQAQLGVYRIIYRITDSLTRHKWMTYEPNYYLS